MARQGSFDPQADARSWFDDQTRAEGWFDEELIPTPAEALPPLSWQPRYPAKLDRRRLSAAIVATTAAVAPTFVPPPPPPAPEAVRIEAPAVVLRRPRLDGSVLVEPLEAQPKLSWAPHYPEPRRPSRRPTGGAVEPLGPPPAPALSLVFYPELVRTARRLEPGEAVVEPLLPRVPGPAQWGPVADDPVRRPWAPAGGAVEPPSPPPGPEAWGPVSVALLPRIRPPATDALVEPLLPPLVLGWGAEVPAQTDRARALARYVDGFAWHVVTPPTPPPPPAHVPGSRTGGGGGGRGPRRFFVPPADYSTKARAQQAAEARRKPPEPASLEEAREVLRQLASALHPDKTGALDPILREHYTQVLTQATAAYHRVLDEVRRGGTGAAAAPDLTQAKRALEELRRLRQDFTELRAAVDAHGEQLRRIAGRPHWAWPLLVGVLAGVVVVGGVVFYLWWREGES